MTHRCPLALTYAHTLGARLEAGAEGAPGGLPPPRAPFQHGTLLKRDAAAAAARARVFLPTARAFGEWGFDLPPHRPHRSLGRGGTPAFTVFRQASLAVAPDGSHFLPGLTRGHLKSSSLDQQHTACPMGSCRLCLPACAPPPSLRPPRDHARSMLPYPCYGVRVLGGSAHISRKVAHARPPPAAYAAANATMPAWVLEDRTFPPSFSFPWPPGPGSGPRRPPPAPAPTGPARLP